MPGPRGAAVIGWYLRELVRRLVVTDRGRRLLLDLATIDHDAGLRLLEDLALRFGAKLEIRD